MGRTSKKWGFLRVQYIFILIFVLWAANILFFQRTTTDKGGIDETFDQTMAIGITSSLRAKSQDRRDAVRSTWLRFVSTKKIKGVFIIGKPDCLLNNVPCDENTNHLLAKLEEEIKDYNDILVVDSTDSYFGLARKTFAFHCWAYDHFPNLEYSMKTDDDIFVRIDTIYQELKTKPKTNFYWGFTWKKAPKVALKTHKNFEANYEPPEYPSFNSGVGNILSADLVKYIADSRNLLRPLSNEDVTIGTWLSTLNVRPTHDTRFQAGEGMCFNDMLTKHPVLPKDMTMFYDRVIARTDLCAGIDASACPYGRQCSDSQVSWTHGLRCDAQGCEPLPRSVSTSEGEEARASVLLAQTAAACDVPARTRVKSELRGNLVANPGFEENDKRDSAFGWDVFYNGYKLDSNPTSARIPFNQDKSRILLVCEDLTGEKAYGASQNVKVDQTVASPILITGWVRTTSLIRGGEALAQDTSIYMHITFEDDSRDLQVTLDIEESLTWRFYSKLYYPSKPVKEVSLSILLAKNKGSMWFDNIQILSLENEVALCTSSFVARSIQPLELPDMPVKYQGDRFVGTPNPLSCRATGPRFMLVWTTEESTFGLHHQRVLESIFYHHPDACVRVFSNTLSRLYFSDLGFYGYDVHVLRYDLQKIANKMPGEGWLADIAKWKEGPHFYAHSSDFLRFLLLYKYGGIYSDFDSILLRPLPIGELSPDFIGVEWCEAEGLAWCVALKDSDFAIPKRKSHATQPTNTFSFSIGLMGFSVGNTFVADILRRFETDYSQTRWGCGTVLASLAYKDSKSKHQVRVVPPHAFYPLGYQDIPAYFSEDNKEVWESLKSDSYALHLFGKVTKKEKIVQSSLVHRALTEFALSNAGFT